MRIDWTTLALQLVNFAILVWLLQRFLYRPVLRMVEARRAAEEKRYAEAGKLEREARERLAALDQQRAESAAARNAVLTAAAAEAEKALSARRAAAEREASALLDEARKTLERERREALEAARRQAIDLGAQITRRLLAEIPDSLRAQAWLERIDRHLESLPPGEREALAHELAGNNAKGSALTVATAAALAPEERQAWRARLGARLGADIPIDFVIDPALIAGAELRFPHATLRFSVGSALEALETVLHQEAVEGKEPQARDNTH